MSYLDRLRRFWDRIYQKPDLLPSDIDPRERLSRFILTKRHIKPATSRVSPQAFIPSTRTAETSVYRTERCAEQAIWEIGDNYVTALHPSHKPVIGRADLIAQVVFTQQLRVVSSPVPHPRHANIIGWPVEREKILMIATELADKATLIIRSPTS